MDIAKINTLLDEYKKSKGANKIPYFTALGYIKEKLLSEIPKERRVDKNTLLILYASPLILASIQILGIFISIVTIKMRDYNYIYNKSKQKETYILYNISDICSGCNSGEDTLSESAVKIFDAYIFNTAIAGVFIANTILSIILHVVTRLNIKEYYSIVESRRFKLRILLIAILVLIILTTVANVFFISRLAQLESSGKKEIGMFICAAAGFFICIFVFIVSLLL
jgi:hypothetical protein